MALKSTLNPALQGSGRYIHGTWVYGVGLDEQSRCAHYHSELDVIAIKMACCEEFYACIHCHEELAGHASLPWKPEQLATEALVLCGGCGTDHVAVSYLAANSNCPECKTSWNPKCSNHYHYYFEGV